MSKHLLGPGRHVVRFALTVVLFALLITAPQPAHGQQSPITASVNDTNVATDDVVILTVTVVDASPQQPRPVLPSLDGLSVIALDIATSVNLIDNKIHTEVTYTYKLQPRRTGTLTIPPIPVKIDNQTHKAAPIEITVTQGAPPVPSPGNAVKPDFFETPEDLRGQDFYVEAVVDRQTPYVGQQIIYTFRFYQAIQIYRKPHFEMPRFNGFKTVGLPVREYNLDLGERTYLVSEIRTALFPKNAGGITIGPAQLMFPGSFFEESTQLFTDPVTVQVKSLPGPAPTGFDGAVGQYKIKSWFSPQYPAASQPAKLHVAITGIGNIFALPEPTWPTLAQWRVYETVESVTTESINGQMSGTRVYERLLISDKPGSFTISPARFVYFDPVAAEYQTIKTDPIGIQLLPAPIVAPVTATPAPAVGVALPPETSDARSTPALIINPGLFDLPDTNLGWVLPIGLVVVWIFCGAVPLALAVGAGGMWLWQRRGRRPDSQPDSLTAPEQRMHPALVAAAKNKSDSHKIVSQALESYLGEILGMPVRGSTRTNLVHQLIELGLDEALIRDIEMLFEQSDQGRYMPEATNSALELIDQAETLLSKLDEALVTVGKIPSKPISGS